MATKQVERIDLVGYLFKRVREGYGLSGSDVATKAGSDKGWLSHIENIHNAPDKTRYKGLSQQFRATSKTLGISLATLDTVASGEIDGRPITLAHLDVMAEDIVAKNKTTILREFVDAQLDSMPLETLENMDLNGLADILRTFGLHEQVNSAKKLLASIAYANAQKSRKSSR